MDIFNVKRDPIRLRFYSKKKNNNKKNPSNDQNKWINKSHVNQTVLCEHQEQNQRCSEMPEPEQFNDSVETRMENCNYFIQCGKTDSVNNI